jgi:hypothetical protein
LLLIRAAGVRKTFAQYPLPDVLLARSAEVGLDEKLGVPKLEAAYEYLDQLQPAIDSVGLPNHVEASRKDANEEYREGYQTDEDDQPATKVNR